MKKYIALFMVITCMGLILIGCNQKDSTRESDDSPNPGVIPAEEKKTESDGVSWDRRPMVMINGEVYLDTNRESDINGRCGVMDGEISSTVDGSEIPTQNNQSNFGSGYEYQYVDENSIDIYMNEKWIRFEKETTDAWGIQLTATDVTSSGLTLVCKQSGGQPTGDLKTGSYYSIEEHIDNEWLPVETLPLEYGWNDDAWMIPMDDTTQWDVDWAWLYGELPVGYYRISKEIIDFRETGHYDKSNYYANFEVTK